MIGHIEWDDHGRAPFIPAPGQIVHLTDPLEQPAGGGAVSAVGLARMGAETSFYTALGSDGRSAADPGEHGGDGAWARRATCHQTRAVAMTDPAGERTIVVTGPNLHPDGRRPAALGRAGGRRRRVLHRARPAHARAGPRGAGPGRHRPPVREPGRERRARGCADRQPHATAASSSTCRGWPCSPITSWSRTAAAAAPGTTPVDAARAGGRHLRRRRHLRGRRHVRPGGRPAARAGAAVRARSRPPRWSPGGARTPAATGESDW